MFYSSRSFSGFGWLPNLLFPRQWICSFASTLVCFLLTSLLFPRVGAHLDKTTSTLKNDDSASRRLQGYGGEAVFSNGALKDAVRLWIRDNGLAVDTYGPIHDWGTSMITDMSDLCREATAFNDDISHWNVSKVTNMDSMFYYATAFNGDTCKWDVSSVTKMDSMFGVASGFNGDISEWDVSSVTSMNGMFSGALAFNGDIAEWDVSSVNKMEGMFAGATAFNGDISKWDVSSVTSMNSMFRGATAFNGNVSKWNVSSVASMDFIFYHATAFEQTLCLDLMSESETDSMFVLFNKYLTID